MAPVADWRGADEVEGGCWVASPPWPLLPESVKSELELFLFCLLLKFLLDLLDLLDLFVLVCLFSGGGGGAGVLVSATSLISPSSTSLSRLTVLGAWVAACAGSRFSGAVAPPEPALLLERSPPLSVSLLPPPVIPFLGKFCEL